MEKTLIVDGREVRLKATAAVPRLYRIKFRRDIMVDMAELDKLMKKAKETGESIPPEALDLFENIAYIMAKHADKDNVPGTPEEWLDGFGTFSIYAVLPEIRELWGLNTETTANSKKK